MSEGSIEIRTAPRDKRFPSQNQTKHCWARYLEYHACVKKKGEEDPECEKFKRWYGSLCPIEWVRTHSLLDFSMTKGDIGHVRSAIRRSNLLPNFDYVHVCIRMVVVFRFTGGKVGYSQGRGPLPWSRVRENYLGREHPSLLTN